jgi:hypothetical protein
MKRKGQVTIFIILAILIVIGVVVYFSLDGMNFLNSDTEYNEVEDFIGECVLEVAQDVIYEMGQDGGYYNSEREVSLDNIPYYNKNSIPTVDEIESEMANAINDRMELCINGFESFPDLNVSDYEISSSVTIEEEIVIVEISYFIILFENFKTVQVENLIEQNINVRVGLMLDISEQILDNIGEKFCLTCLSDIALQNDVQIDMWQPEDVVHFTIVDNSSHLKNLPLEWRFAYE